MPAPHNPRLLRASGAHALLGITVLFGGAAARGAAACAWTVPCTGAVASSGAGVGALRARAPHKKPAVPLAAGLMRREELEGYSARSCRAGAVSAAVAGGVRAQVAVEHLRMRSEMTLKAYDRVLGQERGAASRVLQEAVEAAAQATRRHFE